MSPTINTIEACIDIPECMMAEEIRHVTLGDYHITVLSTHVMHGWPLARAEVIKEVQPILVLQR